MTSTLNIPNAPQDARFIAKHFSCHKSLLNGVFPFQEGIEEMPKSIFSMGVKLFRLPYPHRLKMGLIFLILNIISAIFSRLPLKGEL